MNEPKNVKICLERTKNFVTGPLKGFQWNLNWSLNMGTLGHLRGLNMIYINSLYL